MIYTKNISNILRIRNYTKNRTPRLYLHSSSMNPGDPHALGKHQQISRTPPLGPNRTSASLSTYHSQENLQRDQTQDMGSNICSASQLTNGKYRELPGLK